MSSVASASADLDVLWSCFGSQKRADWACRLLLLLGDIHADERVDGYGEDFPKHTRWSYCFAQLRTESPVGAAHYPGFGNILNASGPSFDPGRLAGQNHSHPPPQKPTEFCRHRLNNNRQPRLNDRNLLSSR